MFIIFIQTQNGFEKHSAWTSLKKAEHQEDVLRENGYKNIDIHEIDCNYENGHYFL